MHAILSPINGLGKEPVISLTVAVVPLRNHIPMIDAFAAAALEEVKQREFGMVIDLQLAAALNLYTREWSNQSDSLYYKLNALLRDTNRQHLKAYFPYLKLLLVAYDTLPKYTRLMSRGVACDLRADYTRKSHNNRSRTKKVVGF